MADPKLKVRGAVRGPDGLEFREAEVDADIYQAILEGRVRGISIGGRVAQGPVVVDAEGRTLRIPPSEYLGGIERSAEPMNLVDMKGSPLTPADLEEAAERLRNEPLQPPRPDPSDYFAVQLAAESADFLTGGRIGGRRTEDQMDRHPFRDQPADSPPPDSARLAELERRVEAMERRVVREVWWRTWILLGAFALAVLCYFLKGA